MARGGRQGARRRAGRADPHARAIDGLERIRYTTSHPNDMDDDLIAAHGEVAKLMPYLHLPVQAGNDRILKAMNRQHTAESYLKLIERFRAARPDIALSGDFIVGFPGETEDEFQDTLSIVDEVRYAACFSFKYSPRPGTPAATMDGQIAAEVMDDRLQRLQQRIGQHQLAFNQASVGKRCTVLVERTGRHEGQWLGKSPWLQSCGSKRPLRSAIWSRWNCRRSGWRREPPPFQHLKLVERFEIGPVMRGQLARRCVRCRKGRQDRVGRLGCTGIDLAGRGEQAQRDIICHLHRIAASDCRALDHYHGRHEVFGGAQEGSFLRPVLAAAVKPACGIAFADARGLFDGLEHEGRAAACQNGIGLALAQSLEQLAALGAELHDLGAGIVGEGDQGIGPATGAAERYAGGLGVIDDAAGDGIAEILIFGRDHQTQGRAQPGERAAGIWLSGNGGGQREGGGRIRRLPLRAGISPRVALSGEGRDGGCGCRKGGDHGQGVLHGDVSFK
jgi:hypothetical protein